MGGRSYHVNAATLRVVIAQRDGLLVALERIAAGDPAHLQFAMLAITEAREAIEVVQL